MNRPVNKAMLEAECRALWRAVYAASIANDQRTLSDHAAESGDYAVKRYRERYKTKEEASAED